MSMTWGQLRLQLSLTAPGVSTDLLDEWIGMRYAKILDHYPWKGLEVETIIQSVAAYPPSTATPTPTVNLTQGSAAVVGTGTTFTTQMTGLKFQAIGDGAVYVFTFVDATHGTLDRAYECASNTAASFWIYQNEYTLERRIQRPHHNPVTDELCPGGNHQRHRRQRVNGNLRVRIGKHCGSDYSDGGGSRPRGRHHRWRRESIFGLRRAGIRQRDGICVRNGNANLPGLQR